MLILSTGCGQGVQVENIDEALLETVNTFKQRYGVSDLAMNIKFSDQSGNIAGICMSWSTGQREIQIDPTWWEYFGKYGKEELMFHELGHCWFGLGHSSNNTTYLSSSIPESIMYPYVFGDYWFYLPNREYYFTQLHH